MFRLNASISVRILRLNILDSKAGIHKLLNYHMIKSKFILLPHQCNEGKVLSVLFTAGNLTHMS